MIARQLQEFVSRVAVLDDGTPAKEFLCELLADFLRYVYHIQALDVRKRLSGVAGYIADMNMAIPSCCSVSGMTVMRRGACKLIFGSGLQEVLDDESWR